MIEVEIRHRLGAFALDARFTSEGRLTALFGRSGSGKTSLVNVIAGLIRPDWARISVNGDILVDTACRVFVPKHRRRIGYVFQEGRLFPHLTVRQNLLYGRWFAPEARRYGSLDGVVELLGIGHLLGRRPGLLSGGEKQRVAIGRALLASPRLLLMDEPLAALDETRKTEILPYLERLRDEAKVPIVYVSHAIAEVARLATVMVVMSEGGIAASGPTAEVMARLDLSPVMDRTEAGAILDAEILGHDETFGLTVLRTAAGELRVLHLDRPIGATVRVLIRARDVIISTRFPEGLGALNVLKGVIVELGPRNGAILDLRLDCGGQALLARITCCSADGLGLTRGTPVYAIIKSVAFDKHAIGAARLSLEGADMGTVLV